MKTSQARVAHCSTCGRTLSANGECVACLVRLGFGGSPDEGAASSFGDYEIARREDGSLWELGRGAMGVTYLAKDRILHRSVALKVVATPPAHGTEVKVRERFLREARTAALLRHPNVAGVFHFGSTPAADRCYYTMELVEGETLEAVVRRDGPLSVESVFEIALQVTRALVAAATRGLVHRDLKPGNIMLTRTDDEAGKLTVKVIDFGLAKEINGDGHAMELTQAGFLGTPAFASPEQFSGAPADARSDIYSLGATLWYALTGEVPFHGRTLEEIRRHQNELPLPVEQLHARKVPKPFMQLLGRLLSLDPAKRPASARALQHDLESCQKKLAPASPVLSFPKAIAAVALIALLAAAFVGLRLRNHKPVALPSVRAKSIAVLPFQNLSDDRQNAYLSDGIHEEILTTLGKVADLKVTSRTSVMQFRDADKRNLREIAQQLGVAHVLEGSVQPAANRVRVTAQLIDARTDSPVWADRYDGELADVFAIQSEIAQKIASQLRAVLSPNEQAALQSRPTRDPEAYDLYLRAREISRNEGSGRYALQKQIPLLDEAVARDPAFVSALCRLAELHVVAYTQHFDVTPARLELARKALEAAARLQPNAAEVHRARGLLHYSGDRDFAAARTELALAQRYAPNDAEVLDILGSIEARLGHWEEAVALGERALSLDPRNPQIVGKQSYNYFLLRRYDEANRVIDRHLALRPKDYPLIYWRAAIAFHEKGDLKPMDELFAGEWAAQADPNFVAASHRWVAYLRRDYRAADRAVSDYHLPDFTTGSFPVPREYYEGRAARGLGERERAEAAFLRARERAAAVAVVRADDGTPLIWLAKIDAMLGRKEEAVSEGERAVQLTPVARDALDGSFILGLLAEVYAELRETDRALDVLQQAAALPGAGPSYGNLLLDEDFDPLRNDPRFQKILASRAPKSAK